MLKVSNISNSYKFHKNGQIGKWVGTYILFPTEGRLQSELCPLSDPRKYSLKTHHKTQFPLTPSFFNFVVHGRTRSKVGFKRRIHHSNTLLCRVVSCISWNFLSHGGSSRIGMEKAMCKMLWGSYLWPGEGFLTEYWVELELKPEFKLEAEQWQWILPSVKCSLLILIHGNHIFLKNASKGTDPESQKLFGGRLQFDLLNITEPRGKILLICFPLQDVSIKWLHTKLE